MLELMQGFTEPLECCDLSPTAVISVLRRTFLYGFCSGQESVNCNFMPPHLSAHYQDVGGRRLTESFGNTRDLKDA